MQERFPRPLPQPNHDTQPYWDAAKEGKLVVQYDPKSGRHQHPPRPYMDGCGFDFEWKELKGTGTIYSYTVIYPPVHPAFEPPYGIALVVPDDAPDVRIMADIKEVDLDKLQIGMPVRVKFETVEDITFPYWVPV